MKIIFTKHALARVDKREITEADIRLAISHPDDRMLMGPDGQYKFIRKRNGRNFQVVAKHLDKEDAWLIISAWVRGEDDKPGMFVRVLKLIWSLFGIVIGLKSKKGKRK